MRKDDVVPDGEANVVSARRWNAFVCPDCRIVFRVPGDHDGAGIVCPSCRMMMKIPCEGDVTMPLMAPLNQVGFSGQDQIDPRRQKKRRSKRKKRRVDAQDWDGSSVMNLSMNGYRMSVRHFLLGVFVLGVTSVVLFLMFRADFDAAKNREKPTRDISNTGDAFGDTRLVPEVEKAEETKN